MNTAPCFHVNKKNVIIKLKYIVPKREIKTVLYLNVKKLYLNKDEMKMYHTYVTPPGPHHHTERISNPGFQRGRRVL